MIEIERLSKRYGTTPALRGISLRVEPGSVYGLLGPNGAGKTTALKILAGLLRPDGGTARVAGHDVVRQRADASRATGFVPDRPTLYEKLTGREFLRFVGDLYAADAAAMERAADELFDRFGLADWADRRVESYSQGMRQKLSLAAALARDPQAFLIDEPVVGLDPSGVRRMKELLTGLAARGRSVLVSTHSLEVAGAICDRLGVLHRGLLIAEGSAPELMRLARLEPGSSSRSLEEAFLRLTEEGAAAPPEE